jgi:nitroreductase
MELIQEITERRAKRAIDSAPVSRDVIRRILDAAVLAPSCANNQSWRFLVVDKKEKLDAVAACFADGNYWAKKSTALVFALTKPELGSVLDDRREYALFDTGMACMSLMLQATREGLIAHPIAGFSPVKVKNALGIPDDYILITIIVLGFAGDKDTLNEKHREAEDSPRMRRPFEEAACFNTWKL